MTEQMGIRAEVWPVAADRSGIWLLADQAWLSAPVAADDDVLGAVELLAYQEAPDWPVSVVHSTSWRQEGPGVILTWIAVIATAPGMLVQDYAPKARPVTLDLLGEVGKPCPHRADAAAEIRYVDVLMHAIRHLRFLLDTDAETADALGSQWAAHLETFRPALAGLYGDRLSA